MSKKEKTIIAIISIILLIILGLCIFGIVKIVTKNQIIEDTNQLSNEPNEIKVVNLIKNEVENTTNMNITNEVKEPETEKSSTSEINVVPTMNDKITADSSWCGTFQLVWNDMKNTLVNGDVEFNPQLEMVENLNKEDFNDDMISEDYYYKIYGVKSLELKAEIEKGIKEKFNQTSDVLDKLDWDEKNLNNPNRYIFYTMLYRKFEYLKAFDALSASPFGTKYKDVEYFGINKYTDNAVGNQIDVLFYNSEDDFALIINTKTNDEVIFYKNPKGETFNEIYENMNKKAEKFKGSKKFENIDLFKAPRLEINELREYTELENKEFPTLNGIGVIMKALQTIKFKLNETGGEIKSEAVIDMVDSAMPSLNEPTPRYFYVDDTFALFLREKGKEKPYYACRVEDITKFQ